MSTLLSSPDIENMVLASSISSTKNLCTVIQNLKVTDFVNNINKEIFLLLREIYKETENINLEIVCVKAADKEVVPRVGGLQNLLDVLTTFAHPSEVESYIELLKEKAGRRDTLALCENIANSIKTKDRPIFQIHEEMRDAIYKVESRHSTMEFQKINAFLKSGFSGNSYVDNIQLLQDSGGKESAFGLSTGFSGLDDMIGGLQKGNLILLAARPGMGKTTLALNIFEHVCYESNLPALFVPLEMSTTDIIEKLISSHCNIDYKKLREATITPIDFQQIVSFINQEKEAYLTCKPFFTIGSLRSAAIRAKDAFGIQLLIVDYLQLIKGSEKTRNENKYQEISEISMSLKNLAREIDLPVICLSQLSRKVEDRQDQMPILSDLRDSGSLEADADIVLFLYRYDHKDPNYRSGDAKLIVAKNRRGQTGEIKLLHNLGRSTFHRNQG